MTSDVEEVPIRHERSAGGLGILRLVEGKKAIVHAHSMSNSKVTLESWVEDSSSYFTISIRENDRIMDSLARLL